MPFHEKILNDSFVSFKIYELLYIKQYAILFKLKKSNMSSHSLIFIEHSYIKGTVRP